MVMELNELAYLVCLHSLDGIGTRSLGKIKKHFGSFQNCFESGREGLYASFLAQVISDRILEVRQKIDPLNLLQDLFASGTRLCSLEDKDYPSMLAQIHDPPYLLYYRGNIEILQGMCIGVVGSRMASNYGTAQSRRFARELASQGMVVVSGMARGIDTEAHRGALEVGGKTAAILGSGLDIIYPPENAQLFGEIANKGIVISEFPPHTHPEPGNFPVRNRLISGLCRGVLVVEAQQRSGALITVDFALEQGRDVFALPGQVDRKNSEGTNNLIKQGAALVTEPNDILGEYYPKSGQAKVADLFQADLFALDQVERQIIDCMLDEPVHIDDIMYNTALSIGELSTRLLQMEFKGIIKALPGNYYKSI